MGRDWSHSLSLLGLAEVYAVGESGESGMTILTQLTYSFQEAKYDYNLYRIPLGAGNIIFIIDSSSSITYYLAIL
jgi:hypothetical protein